MSLTFERPANGACRDLKEFEYVSALHQTGSKIRQDGSITADDIVSFLSSRHGVVVEKERVENYVIVDLAGDPRPKPTPALDIRQLASLQLLPHLKRVAESKDEEAISHCFGSVLNILLNDVIPMDGDVTVPPLLTKDLLRQMLAAYGEENVCDNLLEAMIHQAAGAGAGAGDEEVFLDQAAFILALTSDLSQYDVSCESTKTTHFDDVIKMTGDHVYGKAPVKEGVLEDLEVSRDDLSCAALIRVDTLPTIDLTADTFKSQTFFVLLLVLLIVMYFAYAEKISFAEQIDCDSSSNKFGCQVGAAIADWLAIFVQFGIVGSIFVFFASAGNSTYVHSAVFSTEPTEQSAWARCLALAIGIVLVGCQIIMLLYAVFPNRANRFRELFTPASITKEYHAKLATQYKVDRLYSNALELHCLPGKKIEEPAATISVSKRTRNTALLNFQGEINEKETIGGVFWVWRRYVTKKMCVEEGIWTGARLIAAQVGQIINIFAFAFFLVWAVRSVQLNYDSSGSVGNAVITVEPRALYFNTSGSFIHPVAEVTADFLSVNNLTFGYDFDDSIDTYIRSPKERLFRNTITAFSVVNEAYIMVGLDSGGALIELVAEGLYNATGIDLDLAVEYIETFALSEGSILTFVVQQTKKRVDKRDILVALIYGGTCGLLAMVFVAIVFIPSFYSQVLKFRSGVIPSFTDARFNTLYRNSPFAATPLYGGAIWGVVASGVGVGFVQGAFLFLCIWSETSEYLLSFIAQSIGLVVSLLIKFMLLQAFKKACNAAFYRKHPAGHNVITILLETWSVGFSVGYIIARAITIILVCSVYIGRIDTPLLAPNANRLGKIEIDGYPHALTQDILTHEAHRHCYIERLGVLYMLKYRFGSSFATRAGSCWRLIFTVALMPWMRPYGALKMKPHDGDDDDHIVAEESLRKTLRQASWRNKSTKGDSSVASLVGVSHMESQSLTEPKTADNVNF